MSATVTPTPPTLPGGETADQALVRAQAAAQAKRFNEAAGICEDVLAASPEHPVALALRGIIAALAGDPERGIVLLRGRGALDGERRVRVELTAGGLLRLAKSPGDRWRVEGVYDVC